MTTSVYEVVTDRILAMLEKGTVPWRQTWKGSPGLRTPRNLVSGKEYRGVNVMLLACQGYESPYWLSFKQALDKGGNVRKGEKGTPAIFWKVGERKDKLTSSGKPEKSFLLRYYTVFNLSQCDGIESPEKPSTPKAFSPLAECESLVKLYKTIPPIHHGGGRAFYSPEFDKIGMPEPTAFNSREEYYSTLFHELTHSTGHKERLNREGITNPIQFGSHAYSFEELVAECGASFLCNRAGIDSATLENSAAYIASWSKKLKSEPKWIVEAASKAGKAVDYMLGIQYEEKKEVQEAAE